MTKAQKSDIRMALTMGGFDSVVFHRDSTISAKRGFFYTHGMTSAKKAARVKELLPGVTIVDHEECWNIWPRDSFWIVKFKLPEA